MYIADHGHCTHLNRGYGTRAQACQGSFMSSAKIVLTLNSGSSSLKFGVFRTNARSATPLFSGAADALGSEASTFELTSGQGDIRLQSRTPMPDHFAAYERLISLFDDGTLPCPDAVGHRVVHGGAQLLHHCLIDGDVLQQLEAAMAMAPLHTPAVLEGIRFVTRQFAGIPQVACLDTAFHASMPDVARTLPISREWREQGVQRFGFHGLSCESILAQLNVDVPARLVIAHLGNGASVTAIRHGRSIDNSMGFTPGGGLMMATRCGDLDPGIPLYLLREKGLDAKRLEQLLDHQSGLFGVSSLSGDMRVLRAAAPAHAEADLAIRMFGYSISKHVAAMVAAQGGIDMLVFTGGIGEHDAPTRNDACARLSWLGIELDERLNEYGSGRISTAASSCTVCVIPAQEDAQIARHAWDVTARGRA